MIIRHKTCGFLGAPITYIAIKILHDSSEKTTFCLSGPEDVVSPYAALSREAEVAALTNNVAGNVDAPTSGNWVFSKHAHFLTLYGYFLLYKFILFWKTDHTIYLFSRTLAIGKHLDPA